MQEADVLLSKFSIIRNCLHSIMVATDKNPEKLDDFIIQDAFVLNLQRAVQACIDIANVVISMKALPLPATYKQSFQILEARQLISHGVCEKMVKMTGFRNIAVHDYQELDIAILRSIMMAHLSDFEDYIEEISKII